METSEIIFAALQLFVTIFGFVITFLLSKKEFQNSISKTQKDKQIERLEGLQKEMLEIIEYILEQPVNPDEDYNEKSIQTRILNVFKEVKCYASNDAVRIIKYAISEWYDMGIKTDSTPFLSSCFILISQLKYDTTGIESSPLCFLPERYEKADKKNIIVFSQVVNGLIECMQLKNVLKIDTSNII